MLLLLMNTMESIMNQRTITREQAIEILKEGGVGVMPTDTIYGLVAHAHNVAAVERLYALKSRERKPGTLIAANITQLKRLGVKQADIDKISRWWPGSLSAVLDMTGNAYLHMNVGDIAMRVVADPVVQALLEQTGPLLTSSANLPGRPASTTTQQAYIYFGETVDFYVDGGTIPGNLPSTIIRPSASGIDILRQGSVRI
jgi:L-threonylcarbamoyladenylate synthase